MKPLDKRHDQLVAQALRDERGMELTPDQCHQIANEALDDVRQWLESRGWKTPADNVVFFQHLSAIAALMNGVDVRDQL